MSDKLKTIPNILAEMRNFAKRHWMHDEGQNMRMFADRIEAAYKREIYPEAPKCEPNWEAICARCRDGESPKDCRYYGEPDGCGADGHYPIPQIGNAQKMREALELIIRSIWERVDPDCNDDCCRPWRELAIIAEKALSAPPRTRYKAGRRKQ